MLRRDPYPGGAGIVVTPAPLTGTVPRTDGPYDPWQGVRTPPEEKPVNKIKMRATQYQSVPQGNEKQYVDTDGEFFVFSEQEALARVERRLAERISPEAPSEGEAAAETEADELSKPWPLTLTPEQYLDKYGADAKHSAHARAVIEREAKA